MIDKPLYSITRLTKLITTGSTDDCHESVLVHARQSCTSVQI